MRKMIRNWLLSGVGGAGIAGAWSRLQEWKDHKTLKVAARTDEDVAATHSWVIIGGVVGLLGYPALLTLRLARRHPKVVGVVAALSGSYVVCDYVMGGVNELEEHGPGYRSDHQPYALGYEPALRPRLVTGAFGFKR